MAIYTITLLNKETGRSIPRDYIIEKDDCLYSDSKIKEMRELLEASEDTKF